MLSAGYTGISTTLTDVTKYLATARKYATGIRSTREISGVPLLPLGQVVAGLRDPGWRESDEAAHRRLIEAGKEEER